MRLAAWAGLLVCGVLAGGLTCAALVVRRSRVTPVGLLATIAASAMLGSGFVVWSETRRVDAAIAAGFISIGACIGGYLLATALLPALSRERTAIASIIPSSPDNARVGVVVLSDAEREDYDPRAITGMLQRFEESGAPLPPEFAKPLVYTAERSRYRRTGGSPARGTVRSIARSLQAVLRTSWPDADVVEAFASGSPSLTEAISRLAASGHGRVIVAPLSVTRSSPLLNALASLGARELTEAALHVEQTDPLWSSERLEQMVAARIVAAIGDRMKDAGVCLVEPGEPVELESGNGAAREQSTYFAERVRTELAAAGLASERIRRGWLQWEEPDVIEAARHLAAVGAQHIVFAPVAFPTETLETLLDLRYSAERVSVDAGVGTVIVGAWGDDPDVAAALAERVTAAAERF